MGENAIASRDFTTERFGEWETQPVAKERRMKGRKKATVEQKPPDEGLFDTGALKRMLLDNMLFERNGYAREVMADVKERK